MPSMKDQPAWDDAAILALRPPKNRVDPLQPYAFFVEPERTSRGALADVATILLTNRECPFRCLMCDLWKNTTDERVPMGAIPAQIEYALSRLPPVKHIKLYNAGNFFDAQAIPSADLPVIARQLSALETVIIECHPRLIDERCVRFRDQLQGSLEVALGLETVHPDILPRLNKRMTLEDFGRAITFLGQNDIGSRAFLLLRPPFLSESEGVDWACQSLEYAFQVGVECCVMIPTRAGNGALELLQQQGHFSPPKLSSLEYVLEQGIRLRKGRVFVDLWDIQKLFDCPQCGQQRADRLAKMNHSQTILPAIDCECKGLS